MKKLSTAAVTAKRNLAQQQLTIGLDLGDHSSCYCVLEASGQIVLEQRVSTTAKALREVFGRMPHSRMALETGMHSLWGSRSDRGACAQCAADRVNRLAQLRSFRSKHSSTNKWQRRLQRERPTCTERTSIAPRECGWKDGGSGDTAGEKKLVPRKPKSIPLTPTGLLMEGDYTSARFSFAFFFV